LQCQHTDVFERAGSCDDYVRLDRTGMGNCEGMETVLVKLATMGERWQNTFERTEKMGRQTIYVGFTTLDWWLEKEARGST